MRAQGRWVKGETLKEMPQEGRFHVHFFMSCLSGILLVSEGLSRGKGGGGDLGNLKIAHFLGFGIGGRGRVILHFISYETEGQRAGSLIGGATCEVGGVEKEGRVS